MTNKECMRVGGRYVTDDREGMRDLGVKGSYPDKRTIEQPSLTSKTNLPCLIE